MTNSSKKFEQNIDDMLKTAFDETLEELKKDDLLRIEIELEKTELTRVETENLLKDVSIKVLGRVLTILKKNLRKSFGSGFPKSQWDKLIDEARELVNTTYPLDMKQEEAYNAFKKISNEKKSGELLNES